VLKKVIIGLICFIIVALTAGGVYLYMLDWNKHKTMVEDRFSQITGLKARIEGNLAVELFPSPKFSAGMVKFFKPTNTLAPLVSVNQISAHVDLWKLLNQKFILSAMTLTHAEVNVTINEQGDLNWDNVGNSVSNKSGNIEVSFNDIRLTDSVISYKNLKEKEEFELPSITASISAPTLQGPYKTNGKFIHNNSEIKFSGSIVKNKNIAVNMALENAATSSKVSIEGTLGQQASGTFTFDAPHLVDTASVIFGEGALPEHYENPLYVSFKYNYDQNLLNLDNFNIAYGKDNKGVGTIAVKISKEKKNIQGNFDMTSFNLGLLRNIGSDMVNFVKDGNKIAETSFAQYDGEINLHAGNVTYNDVTAQNLNMNLSLTDGLLTLNRFGLNLLGETAIKSSGNVKFNETLDYQVETAIKTADLRAFTSIFGIDLAKLAPADSKKNIFKKSELSFNLDGNLNQLSVSIPNAVVDSTELKGNVGFVYNDKTFVIADLNATKILFDKYLDILPNSIKDASFEKKLVHQFNLLPWNHDINIEAHVSIASAVYNSVPLEKISLEFQNEDNSLALKKLYIDSFAGANLNLSFDATDIYTKPYFKELSYDIKTNNLPQFASALRIDTGNKPLFQRKLFAAQGALNGNLNNFNLSSVQKFGDTEFSYTGTVQNNEEKIAVDGDLELKANSFSDFVKAINIDYTPDIPVTSFTLTGKLKGFADLFIIDNLKAYLGANNITGKLQADTTTSTPKVEATLSFDKFDANRLFNLNKRELIVVKQSDTGTFITKPILDDTKIDYSPLKSVDFNLKLDASQFVYGKTNYANTKFDATLFNGVLKVNNFETANSNTSVSLKFVLDSNNIPSIQGDYAIKGINIPILGGSTYALEGGLLNAEGSFKSLAIAQKDFFESLDSDGRFYLSGTAFKGWDLDIIKFEIEQRKTTDGFEDSILHNLKSGRSIFSNVRGKYNISKGVVVADNIVWESPVANINMNLGLNLDDWLFTAKSDAIYHNASFADVLKFTYTGNMGNPDIKVDLSESLNRIKEMENVLQVAKNKEKEAKQQKLSGKIEALLIDIDGLLQDISRITLDIVRFKPVTNNGNVQKVYTTNLDSLYDIEKKLKRMKSDLKNMPSEQLLMSIEADLGSEKSKLKFIPKSLEDNFVVDSKYIFDDIFNKIAWVYNVAKNNSSYFDSLTSVYMEQIHFMNNSDTPVDENKQKELSDDIQTVLDEMEKITELHNKIRTNYLSIIDATKVSEMKENNELATQALNTMLTYTEQMDNKIVETIDKFRAVLDISARDYDEYMIYPPKNIEEIDVSKPTIRLDTLVEESGETKKGSAWTDKKKISKIKNNTEQKKTPEKSDKKSDELSSNLQFDGLSKIVKPNTNVASPKVADTSPSKLTVTDEFADSLVDDTRVVSQNEPEIVTPAPEIIDVPQLSSVTENLVQITDSTKNQTLMPSDNTNIQTSIDVATQTIQTPIQEYIVADNTVKAETPDVKDDVITEQNATSLKTNPVIALNIGKSDTTAIDDDISRLQNKKQGFKKAVETNTYTQPIILSETQDLDIKNEKTSEKPKKSTKDAVLDILKEEKLSEAVSHLADNAPTQIDTHYRESQNRYIFAKNADHITLSSGKVGKQMFASKKILSELKMPNQYIFAANESMPSQFSGSVNKATSLYVK